MSGDLLARLIAAGLAADLVAEVAMALARSEASEQAIERRRANDRERQNNRRHAMSRDITGDNVMSQDVTGQPLPLDKETSPRPPKEIKPPHGDNTPRKDRVFVCPDGVDPQHWADLLANRKRKRLANTVTAYRKMLNDLAGFADDEWPPGRIVEFAAGRGWGAIFDPRQHHGNGNHGNSRQGSSDRTQRVDGFTAALRQVAGS